MLTCFAGALQAGEGRSEARAVLGIGAQASHGVPQLRVGALVQPIHRGFPVGSLQGGWRSFFSLRGGGAQRRRVAEVLRNSHAFPSQRRLIAVFVKSGIVTGRVKLRYVKRRCLRYKNIKVYERFFSTAIVNFYSPTTLWLIIWKNIFIYRISYLRV